MKTSLIYWNLFLRFILILGILWSGHWSGGDTPYYLDFATLVCGGQWGGEATRPPLYIWYLCGLSPHISRTPTALQIAIPLFVQSVLVWASGFYLHQYIRKQFRFAPTNLISFFWFFDPALLIYSHLMMSDALFSVCILFFLISFFEFFKEIISLERTKYSPYKASLLGLATGLVLLGRAISRPFLFWSFLFAGIAFVMTRIIPQRLPLSRWKLKELFQAAAIIFFCSGITISPRIYWNFKTTGKVFIAEQEIGWLRSVAGVAEYAKDGLEFYDAETKWVNEHAGQNGSHAILQSLIHYWPYWAWYSLKGTVRVLFGHVNTEWAYTVIGNAPIGPGWFKATPPTSDRPHVSGAWTILWVAGIFISTTMCILVYSSTARNLWRAYSLNRFKQWELLFIAWTLGSILLLAITPLVWGDARFRIAIWPMVLFLWAFAQSQTQKGSQKC